ncbi:hypothetical protein MMC09_001847 [Bachmanniomyces sp. S44760]|nr:hypothetical protein [Bachmanniomyces sp. S44760]
MEGYPRLANLVGRKPEVAIFRRFGALNVENLLFLQAELVTLEQELKEIVEEDKHSDDPARKEFSTSWYALHESRMSKSRRVRLQWEKRVEIRKKLNEYNNAILLTTRLYRLERPDKDDLSLLRAWLQDPKGGNDFLSADGMNVYDEEADIKDDLFSLASRPGEKDAFTRWITGPLLNWVNEKVFGEGSFLPTRLTHPFAPPQIDPATSLYDYNDTHLQRLAASLTTILASLFPIASTIVLYFIQSTLVRLGVVVAFIGVFGVALMAFTQATRIEVFEALAA